MSLIARKKKLIGQKALPLDLIFNGETTVNGGTGGSAFVDFGQPDPHRIVAVVVAWSETTDKASLLGVTIGGLDAVVQQFVVPTGHAALAIAYAPLPSGLSGQVSLSFESHVNQKHLGSFSFYGVDPTPTAHSITNAGTVASRNVNTLITAPGRALVAAAKSHIGPTTYTWTNADEVYDLTAGTANVSAAIQETPATVTVAWASPGSYSKVSGFLSFTER